MAYVVPARNGRWELRESRRTAAGPRSRSLASFAALDDEAIGRARARSSGDLEARELRDAARRAGAPVAASATEVAARRLLGELASGHRPRRALCDLLAAALGDTGEVSDAARAAGDWASSGPAARGEALRDLLLLADRLPVRGRRAALRYPRLDSGAGR